MKRFTKIIAFIATALSCFSAFAFGGRAPEPELEQEEPYEVVTGHVKFYGNAPFEFAGFETEDEKLYSLKVAEGSAFTMDDIKASLGKRIELTGKVDESQKNGLNVLKDGIFVISSWAVLE